MCFITCYELPVRDVLESSDIFQVHVFLEQSYSNVISSECILVQDS